MKRIYSTAIALGVTFGVAGTAAQAQQAGLDPDWKLDAEIGSCTVAKGADTGSQFKMTSRDRIMLSHPNLGDPMFQSGTQTKIRLLWSDGVDQQTDAVMLSLPGGGSANLRPRQVYVIPFDTTTLASRFPDGFTLTAFRDGQQVYSFDGRSGGPYLTAFNKCASTIFADSQPQPPAAQSRD